VSTTEGRHPKAKGLDTLSTSDLLRLMLDDEQAVTAALEAALSAIELAVDDACAAIRAGGRVVYAGAGTSGRLGVLDASEVYPTFGSDRFSAIMAGGDEAIRRAREGAEDDRNAGAQSAEGLGPNDMALGISASGKTPFVMGFLEQAHTRGARCWLLTCNDITPPPFADGIIKLLTGPELVSGSTRLKAGTATKLALNMLSTAVMVRLGGTHDGLMVDVVPSNQKLIARASGIIREITGCDEDKALSTLKASGMRPKVAALMIAMGIDRDEAVRRLENAGGSLRKAL